MVVHSKEVLFCENRHASSVDPSMMSLSESVALSLFNSFFLNMRGPGRVTPVAVLICWMVSEPTTFKGIIPLSVPVATLISNFACAGGEGVMFCLISF